MPFPGGDIVSIDVENLFVPLDRQIETAGLEESIGFVKQLGYLFAVRSELRSDRLVVIVRLFEIGKELDGSLV